MAQHAGPRHDGPVSALQTADARVDDAEPPAEVEPALPAGFQLGSWRVLRALGEGGMGRVYLAEHTVIGRRAAIKVLKRALSHNAMSVERFFDEARAVNSVHHDGIVDVTDLFLVDGQPCIVMELLSGETLAARLAHGPLSIDVVVEIGIAVADALGAAHAAGIVHRDLKPDNIMLVSSSPLRLKVLDFGVAKLGTTLRERGLTAAGAIVGTPEFMAPEQLAGTAVDHRADVYALGIVLFQMLTGTLPFAGRSFGDWVVQHMTVPAPDVRQRVAEVPRPLAALIASMLEKDRDARPASMAVVIDALRAAADTANNAHNDEDRGASRALFPWRITVGVAAAVVVVVSGLAAVLRAPADTAPQLPEATAAVVTPALNTTPPAPPAPPAPPLVDTEAPTPAPRPTPTPVPTPATVAPPSSTPMSTTTTKAPPRGRTPPRAPAPAAKPRATSKSAVVDPFAEDS